MRATITISLPPEIKEDLEQVASHRAVNRSVIVREALADYLFRLRFRRLRERMLQEAATAQGRPLTDEDVFEALS
jgi:predicted transcriptional regulator